MDVYILAVLGGVADNCSLYAVPFGQALAETRKWTFPASVWPTLRPEKGTGRAATNVASLR